MEFKLNTQMSIFDVINKRYEVNHIPTFINRLLLFPVFVWWFAFQLILLSLVMGIVSIGFGFFLLLYGIRFFAFDEVKYGTMFMILPIVSPMVWLLRYFILGEYATLFINI